MNKFQINGRKIGKGNKTYIIAELSANHNQNYDSAIKLIGFYQIPAILGFYIFSVCETLVGFSIGLICFAITAGSNNIIPNAFWAECFGTASLGKIKALAAGVMVVGSALGPLISGFLIDLNFNLNKTLGEERRSTINFRVNNLLGDEKESRFQSFQATDQYFSFRNPGRVISFGYSYKF